MRGYRTLARWDQPPAYLKKNGPLLLTPTWNNPSGTTSPDAEPHPNQESPKKGNSTQEVQDLVWYWMGWVNLWGLGM